MIVQRLPVTGQHGEEMEWAHPRREA